MKKKIAMLLCATLFCASALTGCSNLDNAGTTASSRSAADSVVATESAAESETAADTADQSETAAESEAADTEASSENVTATEAAVISPIPRLPDGSLLSKNWKRTNLWKTSALILATPALKQTIM